MGECQRDDRIGKKGGLSCLGQSLCASAEDLPLEGQRCDALI